MGHFDRFPGTHAVEVTAGVLAQLIHPDAFHDSYPYQPVRRQCPEFAWCASRYATAFMGGAGMNLSQSDDEFEAFARQAGPRLARALVASRGVHGAADAASEALAYAFEHWHDVRTMQNPMGYLFRVGQSRTRPRQQPRLPAPDQVGLPDVEPRLVPALLALPETQRAAVWLVHACDWSYAEVAAALDTTTSMVGNHVSRGLSRLRSELEVTFDA
jgi:DNA-directed RNA polymerase specialized sigma24 family protein